ncbi:Serine/threonine-protein kinase Nek3 [Phytophthora boehmeriae]|uniref:non-specific serine/threonine protein kinase n=1 Tax=Phytophthora boehmeriae TaxID=109152 RepID=A0A8T1WHW5_9STRA|nr:Serine/threonine-protein kinase Nek3 [Phytophthora boehmeriae]
MDKYVKVRKIGQGSFGCAYLATRKGSATDDSSQDQKQQYVIKEVVLDPRDQASAQREARLLAALDHPNIIACKESFLLKPPSSNGSLPMGHRKPRPAVLCIVTEFADGGDLSQQLERRNLRRAYYEPDDLLGLFVQVCLALKHLHDRKILHRDIKPANIFLTKAGIVKLGDLGVATVLSHTLACAQTATGTPYYTPPEICLGKRYNAKADVWSLGCVLFEMASFLHVFDGRSQRQLFDNIIRNATPQLPSCGSLNSIKRELQALIDDMLRKEPRQRPSVNQIIRRPIVLARIQTFLSDRALSSELNHTVLHGQHVFDKKVKQVEKDVLAKPQAELVRHAEPAVRSSSVGAVAKPLKKTPIGYGRNGNERMAGLFGNTRKPRGLPNGALKRSQKRLQPSRAPISARPVIGASAVVGPKGVKKRVVPAGAKRPVAGKPTASAKFRANAAAAVAALPDPPAAMKKNVKAEDKAPSDIAQRVGAFNEQWAVQREQLVKNLAPPPAPVATKAIAKKVGVPKKSKPQIRAYPKPVVVGVKTSASSAGAKAQPPPAPVGVRRQSARQKTPSSARGLAARGSEPSLRERRLEFQRRKKAGMANAGDKPPIAKASPLDDPVILVQQLPDFKTATPVKTTAMPLPPPTSTNKAPSSADTGGKPADTEDTTHGSESEEDEESSSQTMLPQMANLEFERMVLQLKSVIGSDATPSDNESEDEDEQDIFDPNAPPPPYSSSAAAPTSSPSLETLNTSILEGSKFRQALQKRLQQTKPGAVAPLAPTDDNEGGWDAELKVEDPAQQAMLDWMHTYITSLL